MFRFLPSLAELPTYNGSKTITGTLTIGASGAQAILQADAAHILALVNGANAQALRIYNTTDGTNLERGLIRWSSNVFEIGTDAAGTGQNRQVSFRCGGSLRWTINANGHLIANTDNVVDIGASGANRPKDIHLAGVIVQAGIQITGTQNSGNYSRYAKSSGAASNPGADRLLVYVRDGTNVGTLKLVVIAGAGGAETTLLDNIPQS